MEQTLRLAGLLVGAYLLLLWVATVLWVVRDVRARTEDQVARWIGIGLVVVFPLIGVPLYLIIRPSETLADSYEREVESEALISEIQSVPSCPQCRRRVDDEFTFCPNCRTTLREACRSCSRQILVTWRHCPHCGNPQRVASQSRSSRADGDDEYREPRRDNAAARPARPAIGRASGSAQPRQTRRSYDEDLD